MIKNIIIEETKRYYHTIILDDTFENNVYLVEDFHIKNMDSLKDILEKLEANGVKVIEIKEDITPNINKIVRLI